MRLSSFTSHSENFILGFAFNVLNPEEVTRGGKPRLQEVGPFVYKAVTVKDSVDYSTGHVNLQYDEDGETLTYRPRWSDATSEGTQRILLFLGNFTPLIWNKAWVTLIKPSLQFLIFHSSLG